MENVGAGSAAGRIVLRLKSVIWHRSATRFRDSHCFLQGGIICIVFRKVVSKHLLMNILAAVHFS